MSDEYFPLRFRLNLSDTPIFIVQVLMKGGKEAPTKPKGRPKKLREESDMSVVREGFSLSRDASTPEDNAPSSLQGSGIESSSDEETNTDFIDVD